MTPELAPHFAAIADGSQDPTTGVGVMADHAEELGSPLAPIYRAIWDDREKRTPYGFHPDNTTGHYLYHGGHTSEWSQDRTHLISHNFTPTADGNVLVSVAGTVFPPGKDHHYWGSGQGKVSRYVAENALRHLTNEQGVPAYWAGGEESEGTRTPTTDPVTNLRNAIQSATGSSEPLTDEPPVQMSRRPRRLTRVGDSNTHDAMAEEIVRTQDPQGLLVLADFLQENGGAGAYLARRAGENGQHTVDASHPFTPNEWWEGDNPTNNGQWTGEAGQDTQGLPTGPGELEIRSGYNRNTGRGILTTIHHPHGNLRRGSRTVEYHVPVESVADLHHLTADLPEPQRTRIHAHLEPHLPPGGEPAQMSRRVTPRRYSVPAPNPDPGRRGQSPNEVYLRLRAKGIDHDRAARFSGWTGKEPPGAGGVHVPVVNPPVVGSGDRGEPRDDVGGQREVRVPLSRRGGVRRYAENDGRENEFHAHLDANPDDHHARMVFADYLDEQGDPRAAGYRALGVVAKKPVRSAAYGNRFHWRSERWRDASRPVDPNMLPVDWFGAMTDGTHIDQISDDRRSLENAAATAFSQLPPERQAELMNPPSTEEPTHYTRHRKRRQGQVTRYAGEPPDVPFEYAGEEEPPEPTPPTYQPYAWPGGYPLIHYHHDGTPLCAECANVFSHSFPGETLQTEPHYEGPPIHCGDCGTSIESAYGDPDAPEEPTHHTRRPSVSSKVRYAAYRAPAGGMVSRGTHQSGGQFTPDMDGEFMRAASKLAPQQQVPTIPHRPTAPDAAPQKPDVTTGRRRRRRAAVGVSVEKPDVTKLTMDRCPGITSVGTKLSRRLTMTPALYADVTDRKSFMKAITENPDDSTTRKVFADWLEENEPNTHPSVLHTLRNHEGRTWVGLSPKGAVNAIPRLSKEILEKYPNREAYHATSTNRKGQAHRVRISGKMQTWKTRPGEFRVPWKFGMYDNGEFNHNNVHEWLTDDPTAEPG